MNELTMGRRDGTSIRCRVYTQDHWISRLAIRCFKVLSFLFSRFEMASLEVTRGDGDVVTGFVTTASRNRCQLNPQIREVSERMELEEDEDSLNFYLLIAMLSTMRFMKKNEIFERTVQEFKYQEALVKLVREGEEGWQLKNENDEAIESEYLRHAVHDYHKWEQQLELLISRDSFCGDSLNVEFLQEEFLSYAYGFLLFQKERGLEGKLRSLEYNQELMIGEKCFKIVASADDASENLISFDWSKSHDNVFPFIPDQFKDANLDKLLISLKEFLEHFEEFNTLSILIDEKKEQFLPQFCIAAFAVKEQWSEEQDFNEFLKEKLSSLHTLRVEMTAVEYYLLYLIACKKEEFESEDSPSITDTPRKSLMQMIREDSGFSTPVKKRLFLEEFKESGDNISE